MCTLCGRTADCEEIGYPRDDARVRMAINTIRYPFFQRWREWTKCDIFVAFRPNYLTFPRPLVNTFNQMNNDHTITASFGKNWDQATTVWKDSMCRLRCQLERFFEPRSGMAFFVAGNFCRSAFSDNLTAVFAAFGSHIDYPIGIF